MININEKNKKILLTFAFILIAVISFVFIANSESVKSLNEESIKSLDEKKATVMKLTALAAGTSTAITAVPGDVGTPVAEKIADMSDHLLIVLAAIWLQKYLVTITAVIAFKILIPLACILFAINVFKNNERIKRFAAKLLIFAMLVFAIIPSSIAISSHIEKNHKLSIEKNIDETEKLNDKIQNDNNDGLIENIKNSLAGTANSVLKKFEKTLSELVDSIAVLIVTSCLIPILVFVFFIWMSNLIFGKSFNSRLPKVSITKKLNRAIKK
ncbi:MAG: beta-carotene 15,15'-monooxygenase [Eubacterium sp.]|nr:beta-carotene 15,15'-monooxygenase [Eubacterium sp.]